jgi:large subunit ribosomal protein L24
MQIKKNDTVLVTTGKEKGKRGRVIEVYPSRNRLLVEKLNMIKRHTRPNQQLKQGGIMEKESPISVSNVKLICSKCDKPTAVTRKALDDGKRSRVCVNCNEILD